MAVQLGPIGSIRPQFFDDEGNVLAAGTLEFYLANSSTPAPTYTTHEGDVENDNPLELEADGRAPAGIWFTEGVAYKVIAKDADGVVVWTEDFVRGINDASVSVSQWEPSGDTPTYVSATSFTVPGDQTSEYTAGRRLRTENTAGTIYSRVKSSTFGALTTVVVVNDSGTLDAGLSAVDFGMLTSDNHSLPLLTDAHPIRSGSSTRTKLLRLELDGLTADTQREWTVQDRDGTVALVGVSSNPPSLVNNLGLAVTLAGNAMTIAIKDAAGNDPSAASPVDLYFPNATLTTGQYAKVSITSAMSIVIASGATVGTANAFPSRIYVGILDNAGTPELCFWNPVESAASLSGNTSWRRVTNHRHVNPNDRITTVANSGTANSACVVYSTTQRTNVRVIPVAAIRSTQTTAGTWAQALTAIGLVGPKTAYSGQVVQVVETNTAGAMATGSTVVPMDDTLPEPGTDGDKYIDAADFNLQENGDILDIEMVLNLANSAATDGMVAFLASGTGATNAIAVNASNIVAAGDQVEIVVKARLIIGASALNIDGYAGGGAAGTTTLNGRAGGRLYGGGMSSYLRITEITA